MTIPDLSNDSTRNDKYILPRNDLERDRLQLQHEIFTEALDGRLIIDRHVELKPGNRVLDSATGGASWILDLSNKVPKDIEFVGFDISTSMFPDTVPSNVSLYEMSTLDLPSNWVDSFDLINQRLLIAAFTIAQWRTDLSELFRILKPGGAIQLIEVGQYGSWIKSSIALPATKQAHNFAVATFQNRDLLGKECGPRLPALLQDTGFCDVQSEVCQVPLGRQWGAIGVKGSKNWDILYRTFGYSCLAEGGLGVCKSRAEIDEVVKKAKKEWDDNAGVFMQVYAITARKPL